MTVVFCRTPPALCDEERRYLYSGKFVTWPRQMWGRNANQSAVIFGFGLNYVGVRLISYYFYEALIYTIKTVLD